MAKSNRSPQKKASAKAKTSKTRVSIKKSLPVKSGQLVKKVASSEGKKSVVSTKKPKLPPETTKKMNTARKKTSQEANVNYKSKSVKIIVKAKSTKLVKVKASKATMGGKTKAPKVTRGGNTKTTPKTLGKIVAKGQKGGKVSNLGSKSKKVVKRKKLTEEEKELRAKEKAERLAKRDRLYIKGWEGNSDSEGSVDTGALEENVCFECGECTTDESDWETLVLCDRCHGDYHLRCVGLDIVPRKGWVCPRCKSDEYAFEGLKYNVFKPDIYGVSNLLKNSTSRRIEQDGFELPKPKRGFLVEQCFSPARPIPLAWEEMREKGFMCVSRVFPHEVLRKLTHGSVERATKSGRAGNVWRGALREVEIKLNGGTCHNMIDRDGRYDLRLPEFVIEELGLNQFLEPILSRLVTIMGNPAPQLRTQNVVFVPVGSPAQPWHADDSMHDLKHYRYFTILIHLNLIDENCGGTEIWSKKAQRGDMIRNRPGDAFVFHGSLQHRGQANVGYSHRLFYYASFACRQDQNIGF